MLVIGAPGATQIAMGVLQVSLNVLDFEMSMLEAVSMPAIFGYQRCYRSFESYPALS